MEAISKVKWIRYRFKTNSVGDYRPISFNPKYPWWCSGEGEDYVTIVAYLAAAEDLNNYWDDAYDVESDECEKITFTDRFPKPVYFIQS